MRPRARVPALILATTIATGLAGCAAIPLAVIAGALFEAGGTVVVKTGTEYSASGTVRRTFNLPIDDVHVAVVQTLRRMQIFVMRDESSPKRHQIAGRMQGRKVRVQLTPLTPVLTGMQLDVKRNLLASDKATASELLAQIERVIAERADVVVHRDEGAGRDPTLRAGPEATPTPARSKRRR